MYWARSTACENLTLLCIVRVGGIRMLDSDTVSDVVEVYMWVDVWVLWCERVWVGVSIHAHAYGYIGKKK